MQLVTHHLAEGANLDLAKTLVETAGPNPIAIVVGAGRGCVLNLREPVAGVWIPLHGRLQLVGRESDDTLLRGDLKITEPESHMRATGRANAIWVALLGGKTAWRRALNGLFELPTPDPLLLPSRHRAGSAFRHQAIALVRAANRGDRQTLQVAFDNMIDRVISLQSNFAEIIARCPGRSYAQRRQVFLRLQRVHNYLGVNCHLDLDNDLLARRANYSPWHFIRAFRAAYQETPHAYLVRQRLEYARRLLRTSPLAVGEVALASGFENRCAFSRLFRQRFGTTAGSVKRQFGEEQRSRARV